MINIYPWTYADHDEERARQNVLCIHNTNTTRQILADDMLQISRNVFKKMSIIW